MSFTGTQQGMTEHQKRAVAFILDECPVAVGIHGGCIGADEEFHAMLMERKLEAWVHIPRNQYKTSDYVLSCNQGPGSGYTHLIFHRDKDFMQRNDVIVHEGEFLVACPKEDHETLRSGTWATVRRGRKSEKPVNVIYPSAGAWAYHVLLPGGDTVDLSDVQG